LVPVRPYARNVGLARVLSHRDYGRNWLRLAEAEAVRPDVLHVSLPPIEGPAAALAWRKRHGAQLVLDLMDAWPDNFADLLPVPRGLRRPLARVLFAGAFAKARRAVLGANRITAAGDLYLDMARARGARCPMHRCYLGADVPGYRDLPPRDPGPDGEVRFLYLGNFGRSQDLLTLVEAIARLPEGLPVRFTIAGGGDLEGGLLRSLGVLRRASPAKAERVEMPGFLRGDALVKAVREAHVALNLVRPASWIACPYKMGDYLLAGLPVINGLEGETARMVAEANCGVPYVAGDAGSLARVIEGMAARRGDLAGMSRAAAALGAELFDRRRTYPGFARFVAEGCATPFGLV
jgi:glycosyltransferase involved in cell wall biosynthesis